MRQAANLDNVELWNLLQDQNLDKFEDPSFI